MKTLEATVFRTKMCGGGTSYNVYLTKSDKQYEPRAGNCYATTHGREGGSYYTLGDFFRTKALDALPDFSDLRWDLFQRHHKACERLAFRIAKAAFEELNELSKLPSLWAPWTLDHAKETVKVRVHDCYVE